MAGDFSGLTATGRPFSSHERKPMTRLTRSNSTQSSSDIRLGVSCSAETINVDRIGEEGGKRRPQSTHVKRSSSFQGPDGMWDRTQSDVMNAQSRKNLSQLGYGSYLKENGVLGYYDAQARAKMSQTRGSFVTSFCQNVLNRPKDGLSSGDHSHHELEKTLSTTTAATSTTPTNDMEEEKRVDDARSMQK